MRTQPYSRPSDQSAHGILLDVEQRGDLGVRVAGELAPQQGDAL